VLRVRVINQNNYAAPLRPPMECAFSALTLLVGWQEGIQLVKTEWWGAGMSEVQTCIWPNRVVPGLPG